eukprot:7268421-Pyramimonas_sp.AAC.1
MQSELESLVGIIKGSARRAGTTPRTAGTARLPELDVPKGGALLFKLGEMLANADAAQFVHDDAEVIVAVRKIIDSEVHASKNPGAGREAISALNTTSTSASLPTQKTVHRLGSVAWNGAAVYKADSIREKQLEGPTMISCQSEDEFAKAAQWKLATGTKCDI